MSSNGDDPPLNNGKQTHHSIKSSFKKYINHYDDFIPFIEDAIYRVHDITTVGYQFLRAFILEKYTPNIEINQKFIKHILKTVCKDEKKSNDDSIYKPIFDYYNDTFRHQVKLNINDKNLSYILEYSSIEMNTCFENNIMLHFKDYLNKFINVKFFNSYKEEIKNIKEKNEKKKRCNEIRNDLRNMKLDLYTNSTLIKYEGIHKEWLNENRHLLVPILLNDNINFHLKTKTYDFIPYSIYINKEIENLGAKPYQIVPQRNNNVPKHIQFDHAGIVDLLGYNLINKMNKIELNNCCIEHEFKNIYSEKNNKRKPKYNKDGKREEITLDTVRKDHIMHNPQIYQKIVFNTLFNMKSKFFNHKMKTFNYMVKTDGVSLIFDFVNFRKYKYEKKEVSNKNEIIDNDKSGKKKKSKKVNHTNQEDLFKCSSDDFIELENLNENQIQKIKEDYIILGNDPGKKDLCTLMDENNHMFQYSSCERRHNSYSKFQYLIQDKERIKYNIQEIEDRLSKLHSRTMDINKYYEFIKAKNEVNLLTKDYYRRKLHRKLKFKVFCDTKKSEAKLLNDIECYYNSLRNEKNKVIRNKHGKKLKNKVKKIAIGYGNWSQTSQMKNFFSTPGIGFRRLLHSRFLTITVDEFKTSCKYYKDGNDLDNYTYLKRDKKTKELIKDEKGNHITISCHKLLTCENTNPKGETNRIFIDRDRNGSKNILQCFINKLCNKPRPSFLTRD
jgi:hypothetical protein